MTERISEKLTVLRNLLNDELFASFIRYTEKGGTYLSEFLYSLYNRGKENNFLGALQELILTDENAFSIGCAKRAKLSPYLINAYKRDLEYIFSLAQNTNPFGNYALGKCVPPFDPDFNHEKTLRSLYEFYGNHGYGKFIYNSAFVFENPKILPVSAVSPIKLEDLKDYEYEKSVIISNTVNFLKGLPYSDMLLYGDRGTGKSSTVHAVLNKYFANGLRLIEINKENLQCIPEIKRQISANPLKFIIFIDDLSLDEGDKNTSQLKSNLEGSVSGKNANVMIIATSNRRHIVKENYSDRQNAVHANDSLQEQLSLSDRFGITVLFSTTDKAQYLSIVKQLAEDKGLDFCDDLIAVAERWALSNGGRSPRRAAQIVDMYYSCKVKGEQINF